MPRTHRHAWACTRLWVTFRVRRVCPPPVRALSPVRVCRCALREPRDTSPPGSRPGKDLPMSLATWTFSLSTRPSRASGSGSPEPRGSSPGWAPLFGWVFMTFHPPFCRQLELTSEWTRAPQPALSQRSVVTERPRVAAPEPPVRLRLQPWARVHTPLCGAPAAIPLLQELWVQERL